MGHPSKFQRVLHLGLVTASTSLKGGQPNFARCLAISWAGILYTNTFLVALAPNGILPGAKFILCPKVLRIGSVTAQHLSSGCEPNFAVWYREWNYGTFAPCHFQQMSMSITIFSVAQIVKLLQSTKVCTVKTKM